MTRKTIFVYANESIATVPARRDDFSKRGDTYASTTGATVTSAGSVSVGKGINSDPVGHRFVSSSSGKSASATLGNEVIRGPAQAKNVRLTVRPQATQREFVTERLNRSLLLGYMPPLRPTTAK